MIPDGSSVLDAGCGSGVKGLLPDYVVEKEGLSAPGLVKYIVFRKISR
jgi:hypothetical protein